MSKRQTKKQAEALPLLRNESGDLGVIMGHYQALHDAQIRLPRKHEAQCRYPALQKTPDEQESDPLIDRKQHAPFLAQDALQEGREKPQPTLPPQGFRSPLPPGEGLGVREQTAAILKSGATTPKRLS